MKKGGTISNLMVFLGGLIGLGILVSFVSGIIYYLKSAGKSDIEPIGHNFAATDKNPKPVSPDSDRWTDDGGQN